MAGSGTSVLVAACALHRSFSSCTDHRAGGWRETPTAQKYISDKLVVWQQRLKLTDWQISVFQVHRSDLKPKPKTMGWMSWDRSKKTAVIWVRDGVAGALGHRC